MQSMTLSAGLAAARERMVLGGLLACFLAILSVVFLNVWLAKPALWTLLAALPALAASPALARRLSPGLDGLALRHPLLSMLWLLIAIALMLRFAGLALYMSNPDLPQGSVFWFDDFYINHSCFSAYWKADQLAQSNTANIYLLTPYEGMEGRFKLDEFLYPPQFLLLPRALSWLGLNFLQMRALWFVLDALLLAGVMLALCAWIGGAVGRRLGLLLPLLWLGFPILITLQTGNYQVQALALAVLAMILFERNRNLSGGALMALALFKIFPGILCLVLLLQKRWRAVGATIAFSLLYLGAGALIIGSQHYQTFLGYQMPRMSSAEHWAWLMLDGLEGVVAINHSVPALLLKARILFGWKDIGMAHVAQLAWLWSLAVIALGAVAGWRLRHADLPRSQTAALWISLLALGALRSAFVPDDYAMVPMIWLWGISAAVYWGPQAGRNALLILLWLACATVLPFARFDPAQSGVLMLVSTLCQFITLSLCLWSVCYRRAHQA
ncbi:glycosyltransferase family 87 protein [Massilia sp. W12]|uniref:glycosyltransferase family 87 protein n=1 Tax=Massilia sp. W12 TaxID=3126507 RepID=UPI0030CDBC71